jgi:hypothetical protein
MHVQLIGVNPNENSPTSVLMVLPVFGQLSEQITEELDRACRADSTSTVISYCEADYERPVGRSVGRVVRAMCGLLPVRIARREQIELLVCRLRFKRGAFVRDLRSAIPAISYDHLVLVKPMLLDETDVVEIRQSAGVHRITVVLWDALWRTPTIRPILSLAASCFTTELTDAGDKLELLSVPSVGCKGSGETGTFSTARPSVINYFFCGSWSVERFFEAVRLRKSLRQRSSPMASKLDVHLVTNSRLLKQVGRRFGFHSERLSAEENRTRTQVCDVLVDLGRSGQSSPSERLGAAADAGAILLSTNVLAERVGFPMVCLRPSSESAIARCERELGAHDRSDVQRLWFRNSVAASLLVSGPQWAATVLRRVQAETVAAEAQ